MGYARLNSPVENLLQNNPYKDIPRLTYVKLQEVSDIAGITNVEDFDPEGDSQGNSLRWPTISKSVLIRDNYSCRVCGKSELSNFSTADQYNRIHLAVQVHHIVPKKDGGKETFRNLITLCEECHRKTFSNDYAGLPVSSQTTIYKFERKIKLCVREEWANSGPGEMQKGKLRDYSRTFDTATGTYRIVPRKGDSLDIVLMELESDQYRRICGIASAEFRAHDFTTLIAETGAGKQAVRVFTDEDGGLLV